MTREASSPARPGQATQGQQQEQRGSPDWRGWRGCGAHGGLTAKNLEHDGAADGALAFDGLPAVFHLLFHGVRDGALGFALDAVTFDHKPGQGVEDGDRPLRCNLTNGQD